VIRSATKSTAGAGAPMGMPRQRGGQVSVAAPFGNQQPACGTSGFAFQGTNGHVVAQRVVGGGGGTGGAANTGVGGTRSTLATLDRQRYWVIPETHAFLGRVRATSSDRCVAVAKLSARVHAGFWDHRVMNRALFPGAGFLELSVCGACMMGGASNTTPHWEIAVVEGSVPLPLVLSEGAESVTIEWSTDSGGESISLSSSAARVTPHLRAKIRRVVQQQQQFHHQQQQQRSSVAEAPLSLLSNTVFDDGSQMWASYSSSRRVATGVIIERSDKFAPFHTHPASLDNALQLAAACYVPPSAASIDVAAGVGGAGAREHREAGEATLMVPAGFRGYVAPSKNSSGAATLRASAQVRRGSRGGGAGDTTRGRHNLQGGKSQSSSHALLESSGMLLASVKELETRRVQAQNLGGILSGQQRAGAGAGAGAARPAQGWVRGLGEEINDESAASSLGSRRRMLYRIEWDVAPHHPETASSTPVGRVALQSSASSSSLSSVRATAGVIQALQVRPTGGGAAALHTRGCHPHRSTDSAPGST